MPQTLNGQLLFSLSHYGLGLVSLNVLLNQLGLPVPVVPTLIVAGAIAANGQLSLVALFLASALACLLAERELARALRASCNTPLGACCRPAPGTTLRLRAWVGLPDGSAWIADELAGEEPERLAETLAERMRSVAARWRMT